VQGVWYRGTAAREADRLGVSGSASNRADGAVELVLEGPRSAVDAMLRWASIGPPSARVIAVEVLDEAPVGIVGFTTN
jgi:acylphosphatase